MLNFDEVFSNKPASRAPREEVKEVKIDNDISTRRVSVEDKKIINCKADVNQLVPFK